MNLGGGDFSKLRLHHCPPAWAIQQDSVRKKERERERKKEKEKERKRRKEGKKEGRREERHSGRVQWLTRVIPAP